MGERTVPDGWEDAATKTARWRAIWARVRCSFPLPRDEREAEVRDAWELGTAMAMVHAHGFATEAVFDVPAEILARDPRGARLFAIEPDPFLAADPGAVWEGMTVADEDGLSPSDEDCS